MASTAAAPRNLTYQQARERVLGAVRPLPAERVTLSEARGRPLRRAVTAPHGLPPFSNSSMDGYAVRSADLSGAAAAAPAVLRVVEVLPAGRVAKRALGPGEAIRIMTGAQIPEGADAVVPFEEAESVGAERVRIAGFASPGACIRRAGEDIAAGEEAVSEGSEISPFDIALLASLGVDRVEVGRRPRVAVISTGDELLRVEDALRPGAIRDGNQPQLRALLEEAGCTVIRSERAPDDAGEIARRVRLSLETADAVLTIGGVSAGDFDPVKQSLGSLAGTELWRVAMKPGRPQAFGAPEGRLFYGLPGNPASVACVFETLVRPALRRMQGFANVDRPRLAVRAAEAVASREGRTDFVRAVIQWRQDGAWARPAGAQVSGHLTPQARADALLVVPESAAALAPGDPAEALLLRWPAALRR